MKPSRYTSDMKTGIKTSGSVVGDNAITDPLDGVAIVAFSSLRWVVPDGFTFLVLERLLLTLDEQDVDAILLRWFRTTFRFRELDDWLTLTDGEELLVIDELEVLWTTEVIQLGFDADTYRKWFHVHLLELIDEAL